ncbi:hypothetical protein QTP88_005761 [Uroleucon formosanum]
MLAAQRHHAKPPSPEVDEEISGESYFSDSTSTSSILSNHPPSPSPTPKYPKQNNLDGLQQDDSIPTIAKPAFRIPHIFDLSTNPCQYLAQAQTSNQAKILPPAPPTQLFQSTATNPIFSVKIDSCNSSIRIANAGVPQGSCLSPTLFNIYTNDMPTHPKSSVSLFADDTMFYCANHNAQRAVIQLQQQICLATEWFKKWRLKINEHKTIAITFGRTKPSRVR